ncbi:MAG: hypothetical protein ACJ8NS_02595 [Chthoniobacterales bacterium]
MTEPKTEILEISPPQRLEQADAPKNETARISILPRPPRVAFGISTESAPVTETLQPVAPIDTISRPLCWTMFGISALIFLIQIWNYVVS